MCDNNLLYRGNTKEFYANITQWWEKKKNLHTQFVTVELWSLASCEVEEEWLSTYVCGL